MTMVNIVILMFWLLVLVPLSQCIRVDRSEVQSRDSTGMKHEFHGTAKGEILEVFVKQNERWLPSDKIWSNTKLSTREFSEALEELLKLEILSYNHESGYYRIKDITYREYQAYHGNSEEFEYYRLLEDDSDAERTEQHKYRTARGEYVRSQDEVIIADTLNEMGIQYEYEKRLFHPEIREMILPDFTVIWNGQIFFWEHLGMIKDAEYRQKWEIRKKWYHEAGLGSN